MAAGGAAVPATATLLVLLEHREAVRRDISAGRETVIGLGNELGRARVDDAEGALRRIAEELVGRQEEDDEPTPWVIGRDAIALGHLDVPDDLVLEGIAQGEGVAVARDLEAVVDDRPPVGHLLRPLHRRHVHGDDAVAVEQPHAVVAPHDRCRLGGEAAPGVPGVVQARAGARRARQLLPRAKGGHRHHVARPVDRLVLAHEDAPTGRVLPGARHLAGVEVERLRRLLVGGDEGITLLRQTAGVESRQVDVAADLGVVAPGDARVLERHPGDDEAAAGDVLAEAGATSR